VRYGRQRGRANEIHRQVQPVETDPNYVIPVGDKRTHSLMLAKVVCTWVPGAELAGVALKDEIDAFTSEMNGMTSKDHGFGVGTAANGDKYYVRFDGTTTFKGEAPTAATCTWSFTGGTGKLNGLTGKGTCSATFDTTGASVFDIQGEYQLAPAKKGK
jgi:hypothetical protein